MESGASYIAHATHTTTTGMERWGASWLGNKQLGLVLAQDFLLM